MTSIQFRLLLISVLLISFHSVHHAKADCSASTSPPQMAIEVVESYAVDRSPGCWIQYKASTSGDKILGGYTPFEFLCHPSATANVQADTECCDSGCNGICCMKCKKTETGAWEKCPGPAASISVELPDERALPQLLQLIKTRHEVIWAAQTLTHYSLSSPSTQAVARDFLDHENPDADPYESLARAELGLALGKQSNLASRDRVKYLLLALTSTRFSKSIDKVVQEAGEQMERLSSEGPFITTSLIDYLIKTQSNTDALGTIVDVIMSMGKSCSNCLLKLQQIERGEYRGHGVYSASLEGTAAYLLVHLVPLSLTTQANYLARGIRCADKGVALDAAQALSDYRDEASDTAPVLASMFDGSDSIIYRDDVICDALKNLGPGARGVLPQIIARLRDRSYSNQRAIVPCANAAAAMGDNGRDALPALADLVKANSHPEESLRAMCAIEEATNRSPRHEDAGVAFSCQPPARIN